MSALPDNEDAICNAVGHFLGQRLGVVFREVCRPDREQRRVGNQPKAVERIFESASARVAVEHTRIESFPGQIRDSRSFQKLLLPLVEQLTGHLPVPGHYWLEVEAGATHGIPRRKHEAVREGIVQWVQQWAPTLEVESEGSDRRNARTETPNGVPFQVTLYRWPHADGAFHLARLVKNLEPQRAARIATALDAKCPKLAAARQSGQSCLVFESQNSVNRN
jgi:hypothetical protein